MPNHNSLDDMFGPIFDSLGVSPRNNPTNKPTKEKLQERRDELKRKFNEAVGQAKFNYLMELSSVEAQLKKLS